MPIDLDTLVRLEKAASPGPWKAVEHYIEDEAGTVGQTDDSPADAALIVALRNALPDLLKDAALGQQVREHYKANEFRSHETAFGFYEFVAALIDQERT